MKKNQIISIITPTYNSERYILDNLKSIHCKQDYNAVEQIIVDGESVDSTLEIIKKFKKENNANIRLIVGHDKNMYEAINKGMTFINGDIWACINSDDQYYPNILTKVRTYFDKNPDVDVLSGDYIHVDENGKFVFRKVCPKFSKKRLLRMGCIVSQPSTFLRKDVIKKVGYFNVNYDYAADYDFWIRASKACKMKYENFPVTIERLHNESLTSKYGKGKSLDETRRIQKKYYNKNYNLIQKKMDFIYFYFPSMIHPMNFKYYFRKIRNKFGNS